MRFDRFIRLVGAESVEALHHKKVAVFGLGGVGGFAVEGLARSGIGTLIICDFDVVDSTNINRQIIALDSTVGQYKTDVSEARILDINPNATVLAFPVKANEIIIDDILSINPDFVVDAIDDVNAKAYLIQSAIKKDIPIISAMGFANKLHPELIELSTLKQTSVCPLAKSMRKRLKDLDVTLNIPVVYSRETPIKIEDKEVLASSAYSPSVAGLIISSYVINKLIGEIV